MKQKHISHHFSLYREGLVLILLQNGLNLEPSSALLCITLVPPFIPLLTLKVKKPGFLSVLYVNMSANSPWEKRIS